jgi:hypothetical protein
MDHLYEVVLDKILLAELLILHVVNGTLFQQDSVKLVGFHL